MLNKKLFIIAKSTTRAINRSLLGWMNVVLYKFFKKYNYDKVKLYILLKFKSKNVYALY